MTKMNIEDGRYSATLDPQAAAWLTASEKLNENNVAPVMFRFLLNHLIEAGYAASEAVRFSQEMQNGQEGRATEEENERYTQHVKTMLLKEAILAEWAKMMHTDIVHIVQEFVAGVATTQGPLALGAVAALANDKMVQAQDIVGEAYGGVSRALAADVKKIVDAKRKARGLPPLEEEMDRDKGILANVVASAIAGHHHCNKCSACVEEGTAVFISDRPYCMGCATPKPVDDQSSGPGLHKTH